ncbi:MAG: WYL domain-containing protein [Clostridia bacterium]|nr:WYL domain-containing protein [Clostridia bacterium]
MRKINREFTEEQGYKKAQILYVLHVLERDTDRNNTLTQAEIADRVKELRGEVYDDEPQDKDKRTDIRSTGRALRILKDVGYNIHGVNMTGEDGVVHQKTRKGIWLEKEISDEKLQILIDTILFANYIGKAEAKELIDSLISLGGPTIREKKSASARVDGGKVYHREDNDFFTELRKINEAMELKEPKRIAFKYARYKFDKANDKFVLEKAHEHEVSPYHFIVQKGHYYLVGYNHKRENLWHYRLDYIKDVEILKEYIKPRNETELKGKDIGKYALERPYMFAGKAEGIEVRISADRIGILFDTFGESFRRIKDNGNTIDFMLYCTEENAFHWAMQYGSHVEVLKPQSLRNRIRYHVENMMFNYLRDDGDRYTEAIRLARSRKILNLEGIDLAGKTKHLNLKNVRTILLSNNKIDNVDFIKNMPSLRHVSIKNNPITDLSPLKECKLLTKLELANLNVKDIEPIADLPIEILYLGFGKTEDLSAVYKLKNLRWLRASETCADYNKTLSTNWEEFEKRGVSTWISERECNNVNTNNGTYINAYYPYNLLKSVFGRDNVWVGSHEEISLAVDKVVEKFTDREKAYLDLIYKQRVSNRDARKTLTLSESEFRSLQNDILRKFRNPLFTDSLEKFVEEEDPQKNYSLADVIERKKEIEKNSKN